MDFHVALDGRRDLAGQIYRQLRGAILDGLLRPDEALPPSRELARSLAVSRNTVVVAYDRLLGEGFIETRIGAGTYVCRHVDRPVRPGPPPARPELAPHQRLAVEFPAWAGIGIGIEPAEFDFGIGLPDATLFPFQSWRRLVSRELRLSATRTALYGDPAGHAGLRAAIARHVGISRAVTAEAADVTVTSGAQQAIDLIARVLLAPGDRVAVEDPGYAPPRLLMRSLGARVCPVRVDSQGIVVDEIPADARLVYVTPAHQFPLGMPMSLARRIELLTWAAEHDAAIVEDDYDSEFRFGGRPIETLHGLDTHGRVLYVGTFSKTMLPHIRVGFVIAPRSLGPALRFAKFVADWYSPVASQAALARFIDEGMFARHVRKMRAEYAARHQRVRDVLAQQGHWLRPIDSVAGLHLTALLPPERYLSTEEMLRRTKGSGLVVYPLTAFYAGPPDQSGVVLGYGGIPLAKIAAGLDLLRTVLDG